MEYFTDPFQRQFSIADPTINFPFTQEEQFDNGRLVRYTVLAPLFIFSIYYASRFYKKYTLKGTGNIEGNVKISFIELLHSYHITILGFLLGLSICGVITEFLKNLIAKPRPDFIARCGPNLKKIDFTAMLINYDYTICTRPYGDYLFRDGFKSSPSGHSSIAFFGMGYLTLWLYGQMKTFSDQSNTTTNGSTTTNSTASSARKHIPMFHRLAPLLPILVALKIAISRTQDYRHHFKDVILGSSIGLVGCIITYHWFFNSLNDKNCDKAAISHDDYKMLSGGGKDISNGDDIV
ncbi:hypothetical protein PACTADRAFT_47823 [Pachysolen tannophilus NRRL Y-2460]|uniref:Phosphatidic acid phosphatase type 2/haloperoxidase domain-containing protein n=1 Tax=Pachysolen tannophilus NRRL Y-2460 TaxID=669874 RepID=A0A1E4U1W1_PACTA|nr:hypothetical protein PACTADRAFT_47823 [Pachysolen tannophilus NRRL Y-2460]